MKYFGLDFGTANTSLAMADEHCTSVLGIENGEDSMPSTLFFDFEDGAITIGEAAYENYYLGEPGRFLRSFKSALGTATIDHQIRIKRNTYKVSDIIQRYIGGVLQAAQKISQHQISSLVVGRPVQFVDDNSEADARAEASLRKIVQELGVKNVEFQLEPIAAALNYGVTVSNEETVLVVDIGAGTSDFSVVKFSPQDHSEMVASQVISNRGIHIGGNDFDGVIALDTVMPHFGYRQRFKRRDDLESPKSFYLNASAWHKIDLLYDKKVLDSLKELAPQMVRPELVRRLIEIISTRQAHKVLGAVESIKKNISDNHSSVICLPFLRDRLEIEITRSQFEDQINGMCADIIATANLAISDAGLSKNDIDTVYVTGGTMGLAHLQRKVTFEYPTSKIVEGDKTTAVARGLALDSRRRFA